MLNKSLASQLAEITKAFVTQAVAILGKRIDGLEERLSSIPAGERGEPGIQGEKGDQGERGDAGEVGAIGPVGERGEPGETGPQGERGEPGEKGDTGEHGPPGERGPQGEPGDTGPTGRDGKSAYEIAVEKGFAGSESDWLVSLKGEKGLDGKDGIARDGRDGRDGTDGRDGLDIDVLPGIDSERSYIKGTFASHNGGLWVARRMTQGMDGWDCIVDGISDVEAVQSEEDPRKMIIGWSTSSGKLGSAKFFVPFVIDRGVHRDDEPYFKGDGVTWAGSFWIAQTDSPEGRPDSSSGHWRLAVKRGRDGKDGRNGIDKTAPVKITDPDKDGEK